MRAPDLAALLQASAATSQLPGFTARTRRGRVEASFLWRRPEPVRLVADPARGRLVLADVLPFVLPGGSLHRAVKAWVSAAVDPARDAALCLSRRGHLTIGLVPAERDWAAALGRLLALGDGLHAMLRADWPDYATGVFAPPLVSPPRATAATDP